MRYLKTPWAPILTTAVVSSAVTLFVARNFMPTEKKIRRRVRADYGIDDPVFERVMSGLLGPPLVDGNHVTTLHNGDQIFPAMLEAIGKAERSITFENFLWHDGEVAMAVAEALVERANAGVSVHVLQDGFGCDDLNGRAMTLLRNSPVKMEIFRFLWVSRINFRTHRKLLVIDGRVGFIGGVCIADTWKGDGRTPGHWRDTHYRVEGPVVSQMQQAFLDNWMQTRAQVLHGEDFFPGLDDCGGHTCQAFRSSAGEGADSARLMFLLSVAAARKHLRIASAFFLPDNLMIETLLQARERGVEVDVIAPGPDNDAAVPRLAGRSRWGELLKAGVRIWEYEAARFHWKCLIVDDRWCSVGSSNIDHRSMRLNEEANLNVLDSGFAAEQTRQFEKDLGLSRQITLDEWRARPLSEKVIGGTATLTRWMM